MTGSTACARVLLAELIRTGVRDVVLCPGSRDAPLSYAAFEADRDGLLRLHVRIDERSAAFTALGMAKAAGSPVPVITTSGTAAGNLHPAVMEAAHADVPLVAVTADRPARMMNTGANQTTRQPGLYAAHVRAEAHLTSDDNDPRGWRFQIGRALSRCDGRRSGSPGPIHLNVAFSEPLTPEDVELDDPGGTDIAPATVTAGPVQLPGTAKTVAVAGDSSPADGIAHAALAERAGIPLLAEPSSNARGSPAAITGYRILLQSSLARDIERVIVLGHPTLSRPVTQLMRRDDVELIVVDPHDDWTDPTMHADRVLPAVDIDRAGSSTDWLRRWQQADAKLRGRIAELTEGPGPSLTGPHAADVVWSQLTGDDVLFAGSSSPIRDLDLAGPHSDPPICYANRGLAGIDGSVSTAAGIALATGRGVHALLGDLTFWHDTGGLTWGEAEPQPRLRILIANDHGGSIFATLEHGSDAHRSAHERMFATPAGLDLSGFAAAAGARYTPVTDAGHLRRVLRQPIERTEIVDIAVDRGQRRGLEARLDTLADRP